MEFNRPVRTTELAAIGRLMGAASEGDDEEDGARAAVAAVAGLAAQVGLPSSLAELGVSERELPELARQALGVTRLVINNPREPGEEELIEILRAAWRGELAPAGARERSASRSPGSAP
jgi:alcohol dehydrogenase